MRTYLRNRTAGGLYFFTVNLAERNGNALLTENIGSSERPSASSSSPCWKKL